MDAGPTVVGTTPGFAGGSLTAGATTLTVRFSEAVLGGELAANYQIQSLGPDSLLGTADDAVLPISASYAGTAATLNFPALPESIYRLTIRDSIENAVGNALDGDADGAAGGNWVREFVASPPNKSFQAGPATGPLVQPESIATADFNSDGVLDLVTVNVRTSNVALSLGDGAGSFNLAGTFPTGGFYAKSVAVGDFNADGYADLAVANGSSNNVGVLLGNGAGGFATALRYVSGGLSPQAVATGDFNGDGNIDIAVANSSSDSNSVGILLGNGRGGFASAVVVASGGSNPWSLAVGDFNADGYADLAAANRGSNTIGVLLGNGAGVFSSAVAYASGGRVPFALAVGEFNGDGRSDLVVAHRHSLTVRVLLGNGAGEFPTGFGTASGGIWPESLAVADFNGDGKSDVAVGHAGSSHIGLLLGRGDGRLAAPVPFGTDGGPDRIVAGDFNRDGHCDLAMVLNGDGLANLGLLLGDGNGAFAAPATTSYGASHPYSVTVNDFNADGKQDFAALNYLSSNIGVLLGDGATGFSPAVVYDAGNQLPPSITSGDVNGDGKIDLVFIDAKINILLGNGVGGFASPVSYSSGGSHPWAVVLGDFNLDGRDDLVVTNDHSANVGVLLADGAGGFFPAVTYASGGSGPQSIAKGDFNSDGKPDLAVGNLYGRSVGILLGDGAGRFAAPTNYASGMASSMATGDFNADGKTDIAVANPDTSTVNVLLGRGAGSFSSGGTFRTGGTSVRSVTAGDFNGDGATDLAVANHSGDAGGVSLGNVGVLLANNSGGFALAVTYAPGGSTPQFVTSGDFNADGKLDLVVANYESSNLGILLGTGSGTFAPASAPSLGVRALESPGAFRFSIQTRGAGAGQLVEATGNAFDGAGRLEVAGQVFAPVLAAEVLDDGNRTVVTPVAVIAGLYVSREVMVPDTGNEDFARTVEVLTNPMNSDITTTLRLVGNLGSDGRTAVWKTSDGDGVIETTDQWIGTDDVDGIGTPAIVHYVHGRIGLKPTAVRLAGDRGDNIEWTYEVTVPAGETVRLAHYTILADTRAEAEAAATALVTPAGPGGQAAAFLTQEELDSLVNFVYRGSPTIALTKTIATLAENTDTSNRIKVADIYVTDDGVGTNNLTLSGPDAAMFEIDGDVLYLKAGTQLDYATNPTLDAIVAVDDPAVGASPDDTASLSIAVTDLPADLRMVSVDLDGRTGLSVTYEISGGPVPAFEIGFFRSSDADFGGDYEASVVQIDGPEDLGPGSHTKTFNSLHLPGAGLAEHLVDYYLLGVIDPEHRIPDRAPANNTVVVHGVYHNPGGFVMIQGTDEDDRFVIGPEGVRVDFNGTVYNYPASDVAGVQIRGHGGNDQLEFDNGVRFGQTGVLFSTFYGGSGANTAKVLGSTSATSRDLAKLWPDSGEFLGVDHTLYVKNMQGMTVHGRGGPDEAHLYDSASDDTFDAYPTYATMADGQFTNRVEGFRYVTAYATQGTDAANFFDGAASSPDYFTGYPTYSIMTDGPKYPGKTYFNRANSFEVTAATSSVGADIAALIDSAYSSTSNSFTFTLDADLRTGTLERVEGGGALLTTSGFRTTVARSQDLATDTVKLIDSSATDTLTADMHFKQVTLTAPNATIRAVNAKRVEACSINGGDDTARFYDSEGDDLFIGRPNYGELASLGDQNVKGTGFRHVYAYANRTGTDTAHLFGIDGKKDYFAASDWYATMADSEMGFGTTYYVRANQFDEVHGHGTTAAGRPSEIDRDQATLYDAATADLFEADATTALATYRYTQAATVNADGFRVVKAYGSAVDTANLYGPGQYNRWPNPAMWTADYTVWVNHFASPNWYPHGRTPPTFWRPAAVDAALLLLFDDEGR